MCVPILLMFSQKSPDLSTKFTKEKFSSTQSCIFSSFLLLLTKFPTPIHSPILMANGIGSEKRTEMIESRNKAGIKRPQPFPNTIYRGSTMCLARYSALKELQEIQGLCCLPSIGPIPTQWRFKPLLQKATRASAEFQRPFHWPGPS